MKKVSATLAALFLLFALTASSAIVVQAQDRDDRPQAERREDSREEHPVIRQAIKQLQQTKYLLEHRAAHDFGGHRVQAVQSIDQAIEHLNQALRADKR